MPLDRRTLPIGEVAFEKRLQNFGAQMLVGHTRHWPVLRSVMRSRLSNESLGTPTGPRFMKFHENASRRHRVRRPGNGLHTAGSCFNGVPHETR